VPGTELDLARAPYNFTWVKRSQGDLLLAHGRDPYFAGWPDTLQLNYANPATQAAMASELLRISGQCDGVRCDMAMLVLPDVFERTWGQRAPLFWPQAIDGVREQHPEFCFMAEVYWDREWEMQQQGFDYAYDKCLYDRLRHGEARSVREHFWASLDYQDKLARFLENHDEPRAAATVQPGQHEAAAAVTFLSPGLRFFHQGQLTGHCKRISPHLGRGPDEPVNESIQQFYDQLLKLLQNPAFRNGEWRLLECVPAWDGNGSHDNYIAFSWTDETSRWLVAVNYAATQSQCFVRLPWTDLSATSWAFHDQLQDVSYERSGHDLQTRGLYLDEVPWRAHVFRVEPVSGAAKANDVN